jgi:hypothetical protein
VSLRIGARPFSLLRRRLNTTSSWMVAAFLVAAAIGAIVLCIFRHHGGAGLALRLTARWSFLLFWLAYVGGAMARLWGTRFGGLARRGRELGLSFASAQLVHIAIVLWVGAGGMTFFWVGILFTYLLALFSVPRLQDILGLRLWRICLSIALNYIALVFAADFILLPLETGDFGKYPLTYLPFAVLLVSGAVLRMAAFLVQKSRHLQQAEAA